MAGWRTVSRARRPCARGRAAAPSVRSSDSRDRQRALPVEADTAIAQVGARRGLVHREGQQRGEHERRKVVHGVLVVVLREQEDTRLPPAAPPAATARSGAARRRGHAHFLGELEVLLDVAAGGGREGRVVEVGLVLGLPAHEPGGRGQGQARALAACRDGGVEEVAVGMALEIAGGMERTQAQAAQVVQRVIAVARPLAGRRSRAPARRGPASTAAAPCRTRPTANRDRSR